MKLIRTVVLVFFITTFLNATLSPGVGLCQTDERRRAMELKVVADGHLRRNDSARAIDEYKKAIALSPSSTALYFNLAVAYFSDRKLKEASSALEKLVELDPRDVEAHYNLGCLFLYQRDLDKAKFYIEKAKDCCDPHSRFAAPILRSAALIQELEKLDPLSRELIFLLVQRDLTTTL